MDHYRAHNHPPPYIARSLAGLFVLARCRHLEFGNVKHMPNQKGWAGGGCNPQELFSGDVVVSRASGLSGLFREPSIEPLTEASLLPPEAFYLYLISHISMLVFYIRRDLKEGFFSEASKIPQKLRLSHDRMRTGILQ